MHGGLAGLYFFSDPHDSVFRTIGFAHDRPTDRPTNRPRCGKTKWKRCPYVRAQREYLIFVGNQVYPYTVVSTILETATLRKGEGFFDGGDAS